MQKWCSLYWITLLSQTLRDWWLIHWMVTRTAWKWMKEMGMKKMWGMIKSLQTKQFFLTPRKDFNTLSLKLNIQCVVVLCPLDETQPSTHHLQLRWIFKRWCWAGEQLIWHKNIAFMTSGNLWLQGTYVNGLWLCELEATCLFSLSSFCKNKST